MSAELLRVLHVFGCLDRGGAETMIMNLYRHVDRDRIQFDFITHTQGQQAYVEEIEALGGRVFTFEPPRPGRVRQTKKQWKAFFKAHPEYKILHSHLRSFAALYLPIAKKNGLTTIIHSHSTSDGKGVPALIKRCTEYPLRYQADHLLACSTEAGRWLFGNRMCRSSKYMFFPNAIDVARFGYDPQKRDAVRKELGVEDRLVLGHVGRFMSAKNHPFLLEVFRKVHEKRNDSVLLLVGDGALRPEIEAQVDLLGLTPYVIFTGVRNDVPDLLQAMDLFVFPSLWEGLPVTVVEAQATGLPCLISDRISTDVDLSALVRRLPIRNAEVWRDAVLQCDTTKKDVSADIKAAGFDVQDAAERLTAFYRSLTEAL